MDETELSEEKIKGMITSAGTKPPSFNAEREMQLMQLIAKEEEIKKIVKKQLHEEKLGKEEQELINEYHEINPFFFSSAKTNAEEEFTKLVKRIRLHKAETVNEVMKEKDIAALTRYDAMDVIEPNKETYGQVSIIATDKVDKPTMTETGFKKFCEIIEKQHDSKEVQQIREGKKIAFVSSGQDSVAFVSSVDIKEQRPMEVLDENIKLKELPVLFLPNVFHHAEIADKGSLSHAGLIIPKKNKKFEPKKKV